MSENFPYNSHINAVTVLWHICPFTQTISIRNYVAWGEFLLPLAVRTLAIRPVHKEKKTRERTKHWSLSIISDHLPLYDSWYYTIITKCLLNKLNETWRWHDLDDMAEKANKIYLLRCYLKQKWMCSVRRLFFFWNLIQEICNALF